MRVLVCGGRDFVPGPGDFSTLASHLMPGDTLIHGGARGCDRWAECFAKALGCEVEKFEADWSLHGKAAGPIRNARMLAEGVPGLVLAFPGGRGTEDMARQARAAGVRVIEVRR